VVGIVWLIGRGSVRQGAVCQYPDSISHNELLSTREELRVSRLRFIESDSCFLLEGVEAEEAVVEFLGIIYELVPVIRSPPGAW
jgi:hypothetical protein